jgi:hypothetical protein
LKVCAANLTSRTVKFQRADKLPSLGMDEMRGAVELAAECVVCLPEDQPGGRELKIETVGVAKSLKSIQALTALNTLVDSENPTLYVIAVMHPFSGSQLTVEAE